ncbi:beta-glucosidase 22-like isoform X2 [Apium graveolens]|uniref:beta-glucosidase 22-like isoform X2 n=1 Tax=Apium graveolens TaxID=4045 RepID=UPI003D7BC290
MLPMLGYDAGMMPPRRCSSFHGMNCTQGTLDEPYKVAHNTLLAHALAARLYKRKYKAVQHGFVGLNVLVFWFSPWTNTTEDLLATQRANEYYVGWFVNPLMNGDSPDVIKKNAGKKIPSFTKTESLWLKGSLDFVGVNHYASGYIKDQTINLNVDSRDVMADMAVQLIWGGDGTEQYQGLTHVLEYFKDVYRNLPVYIHENDMLQFLQSMLNKEKRLLRRGMHLPNKYLEDTQLKTVERTHPSFEE